MLYKQKIALVYDRVNKWGGAEKTLLALHEIFPEAPLYAAVYDSKKAPWAKVFPQVIPSFLQNIPVLKNHHELLGWLTPIAFESLNFQEYDLVISLTSEAAKGVITNPHTRHLCICLTPTRYLWSGYKEYQENPSNKLSWIPFYKFISQPFLNYTKLWDKVAAQRADEMVAISTEVQSRIKKYYGRVSKIIYPPVDIEKFQFKNFNKQVGLVKNKKNNYFLIVGRLVGYKRVDLAIKAFNQLGLPLIIVGTGSEAKRLKSIANPNIKFRGFVADDEVIELYQNARALIFPGEEDFGIVMAESLASGTPVIAFSKGGALDIVKNKVTGILFKHQTVDGILEAVKRFENANFDKKQLVESVRKFSKKRFQKQILDLISSNSHLKTKYVI